MCVYSYMPFSHVHTTANNQPEMQYAGCSFKNRTKRGAFGDALAEADWIIGNMVSTLEAENLMENTLILFTGDKYVLFSYSAHIQDAALLVY